MKFATTWTKPNTLEEREAPPDDTGSRLFHLVAQYPKRQGRSETGELADHQSASKP